MRYNRKTARLAVTPHKKLNDWAVLPRFGSYAAVKQHKNPESSLL